MTQPIAQRARFARHDSLDQLDPFDHAFVDAVLQLRGIDEQPTFDQLREALQTLSAYYTALMQAPASSDPRDEEWLQGHTIDSAAFQFAYLFTQCGVLYVSQASAAQRAGFAEWWRTGEPPVGTYAASTTCS